MRGNESQRTSRHSARLVQGTANLDKLPLELYEIVLSFLPGRKDLSAFSRTSKQHRILVESTLYREIRWTPEDERAHNLPVHLLLRTLSSRPELASYVNCLALCCRKPRESCDIVWKQPNQPDLTSAEMRRMRSLINPFDVSTKSHWTSCIKKGEVDVFVALLIFQLTNLRRLHLHIDYQKQGTFFLGAVLEKAAAGDSLRALEYFDYCDDDDILDDIDETQRIDPERIKPLFSISSLRTIRASLPYQGICWPSPKLPVSGLSSLDLYHSLVSEENLGRLLIATPSLKSLKYDAWIDIIRLEPMPPKELWAYFDCAQLGRSLANVQQSLQTLYISLHFFSEDERFCDDDKFRGIAGRLETLRDFKQLSTLTMPTALLSDWTQEEERFVNLDHLPPRLADLLPMDSLVDVYLSDYDELYECLQPDEDSDYDDSMDDSLDDFPFGYLSEEETDDPSDSDDDERFQTVFGIIPGSGENADNPSAFLSRDENPFQEE